VWLAGLLAGTAAGAEPLPLTIAVAGTAEEPAYLPVHAAAALGTFEAEGLQVTIKRTKTATAAMDALRGGDAGVAVTTLDAAIHGGWMRKAPVQVLAAHVRAPALALLVAPAARETVRSVADLRGKAVGMPGPGTTGHLVLAALLRAARVQPWQLDVRSVGSPALLARLGSGDLAAAMVDEPWASRLVDAGRVGVLVDLRQPEETEQRLGGPFYEVVSVAAAPPPEKPKEPPKPGTGAKPEAPPLEPPAPAVLAAYARAVGRVQAWLAATAPAAVAERLPAALVGDRARFARRLAERQAAYAGTGEATAAGLEATLRVLRGGGSPWPVTLALGPGDLAAPPAVDEARRGLGAAPPPP
jgi:NitT/TauT family transport system substrate-binding protein